MGSPRDRYRSAESKPGPNVSQSAAESATADPSAAPNPESGSDATRAAGPDTSSSAVTRDQELLHAKRDSSRHMNLTYWETVVVGWRILWEGIGGFVLALFLGNLVVVGLLPELTGPCRSTV